MIVAAVALGGWAWLAWLGVFLAVIGREGVGIGVVVMVAWICGALWYVCVVQLSECMRRCRVDGVVLHDKR